HRLTGRVERTGVAGDVAPVIFLPEAGWQNPGRRGQNRVPPLHCGLRLGPDARLLEQRHRVVMTADPEPLLEKPAYVVADAPGMALQPVGWEAGRFREQDGQAGGRHALAVRKVDLWEAGADRRPRLADLLLQTRPPATRHGDKQLSQRRGVLGEEPGEIGH